MPDLELRQFHIREASWQQDGDTLSHLRRLVFILEQKVPQEEEWDGQDDTAWHWLATDTADKPIGTARLLPTGQIGRMAVLNDYRGLKVGAAMLENAVEKARHLGFTGVWLNAQSHALGFYEKAGFVAVGEEFMEAGIAHFRMEQPLQPLADPVQRKPAAGELPGVGLRDYDTAEVSWVAGRKLIRSLRKSVLVAELGLPQALIESEDDASLIHFQSQRQGQTVGALRMSVDGRLSRLVVDSAYRRRGIGQALLEAAIARAQRFGLKQVQLDALIELDGFYQSMGFDKIGAPFDELGRSHQHYQRQLSPVDLSPPARTRMAGKDYPAQNEDETYVLGETPGFLLLRRESEFSRVLLAMSQQARHAMRIFSPLLDHKLFDQPELYDIVSALARRNKYTRIEILLYDSHRVIKNGHALLEIARRLPSSVAMKIVHPELRQLNHEYVLLDDAGVIYRQDYENYEGYANFKDVTECNRLGRQFRAAWESGLQDPNLRQLKI